MATEKEKISTMRYNGLIKGISPFICTMTKNTTAFFKHSIKYIVSYRENIIFFQSLDFFKEIPNKKHDYEINIKNLYSYAYAPINSSMISFSIMTRKKGIISLIIYKNIKKRVYSQISFGEFLDYLKEKGIIDEDEKNRQTDKKIQSERNEKQNTAN